MIYIYIYITNNWCLAKCSFRFLSVPASFLSIFLLFLSSKAFHLPSFLSSSKCSVAPKLPLALAQLPLSEERTGYPKFSTQILNLPRKPPKPALSLAIWKFLAKAPNITTQPCYPPPQPLSRLLRLRLKLPALPQGRVTEKPAASTSKQQAQQSAQHLAYQNLPIY